MKQAVSSSRTADKFVVRLPDGMRGQIANKARRHHRSMNSQIVAILAKDLEMEYVEEPAESNVGFQVHVGLLVKYRNDSGIDEASVIRDITVNAKGVFVTFTEEIGFIVNHQLIEPVWYPIDRIKPYYI